jgi:hypothetical protein
MSVSYYQSKDAENAMAVLADWIGKRHGVKVVYHDGTAVNADIHSGTVRIPKLACASGLTQESLYLLRARAYHEFGHIAETKLAKAETPKEKARFNILNALEDRRIERVLAGEHEGCRMIFRWGSDYFNKKIAGQITSGEVSAPLWEALCAMSFMSEGMIPAWVLTPKARAYADAAYSEFVKVHGCESTKDCMVLADKIYEILKDKNEDMKEQAEKDKHKKEKSKKEKSNDKKQDSGSGDDSDDNESGESEEKESKKGKSKSKKSKDKDDKKDSDKGESEDSDDKSDDGEKEDSDKDDEDSKDGKDSEGSDDSDDDKDSEGGESKESEADEFDKSGDKESDGADADGEECNEKNDSGKDGGEEGGSDGMAADIDSDESDKGENGDNDVESNEGYQYKPDDSGKDDGMSRSLDEEVNGTTMDEILNEKLEEAFQKMDPRDTEYLALRDNDEHNVPATDSRDNQKFIEQRNSISVAVSSMTRALEQALRSIARCRKDPYLRRGKIDKKRLVQITKSLSKEIFYQTKKGEKLDVAVEVIIDESGSMSNWNEIQLLAIALGETLNQIGIPFEITGSTTKYLSPGSVGLGGFTRVNPIVYNHYKTFGETWQNVRARMVHTNKYKHNIDGEVVEYAAMRLASRQEGRKVIFSLSDGEPVAGHRNDSEMAANLIRVCERSRKNGIEVFGFGIATEAPKAYYNEKYFIPLETIGKMGDEFIRKFAEIVTKGKVHV